MDPLSNSKMFEQLEDGAHAEAIGEVAVPLAFEAEDAGQVFAQGRTLLR